MTDQLKKVKACGICKIVTDDGVNTAPCHCPKNTDPLKELEELEEWCNSKKIDLPEWVDVSNGIPVSIVEAFRVKDQGYNKALEEVLAKIAEMRKVDT